MMYLAARSARAASFAFHIAQHRDRGLKPHLAGKDGLRRLLNHHHRGQYYNLGPELHNQNRDLLPLQYIFQNNFQFEFLLKRYNVCAR